MVRKISAFTLLVAVGAAALGADLPATLAATESINSYEVLRNGKRIGTHEIRFRQEGDALRVVAETNMKVKFLFITAYKYRYVSEEVWKDGQLLSVETEVNDNGKERFSSATLNGEGYKVARTDGADVIPNSFMTTNHWNDDAPAYSRLFNTITGKINEVTFTPVQERVGEGEQEFSVRGELNINTFYDPDGHWLGMVFEHKDGSEIEFRCVDCRNMPEQPA